MPNATSRRHRPHPNRPAPAQVSPPPVSPPQNKPVIAAAPPPPRGRSADYIHPGRGICDGGCLDQGVAAIAALAASATAAGSAGRSEPQPAVAPPAQKPLEASPPPAPVIKALHEEDADTPLGDWQTENKGVVRIAQCGKALCGYTLNPSSDDKGEAVLINMKPKTERAGPVTSIQRTAATLTTARWI